MEDIKAQVKEVVKKFTKDYVSEVVKESTKKLIKGLLKEKKEALEAELKNRSVEEIERYFSTKAEFNNAFESTVDSIKEASLEKIQASFEKSFSTYLTPKPPTFIGQVARWIKNPLHAGIISVITIATVIALIVITSPPPAPYPDDGVTDWSSDNTPTFSWSPPSHIISIVSYYYRVDSGSETETTLTSVPLPSQPDGTHNFSVRAKDNAGNIGAYGYHVFKIDTIDPTGSITINNGATYATSTSASLSLSYSDSGSGVDRGQFLHNPDDIPSYSDSGSGVDQVRYSNDGTWDTEPWEAVASSISWTLTSGDGSKTVYYQVKDRAGRSSQTYSDTIMIDTTDPTGSITINNGATYATSTSASLSLNYSDSGSGVDQVRYSNDGIWDTEPWEAPAISKSWTLTGGDGTKTVYYQIKDKAGRLSQSYYDTIILDTTPPTITYSTPPTGGGWSIYTAITVTFSKVMNQASAESAFSTSPVTKGSFSWSGNTMIYTPSPSLAYSTTYTVTVGTGAKDLAGNSLQLPYSWRFTTEKG